MNHFQIYLKQDLKLYESLQYISELHWEIKWQIGLCDIVLIKSLLAIDLAPKFHYLNINPLPGSLRPGPILVSYEQLKKLPLTMKNM